MLKHLLKRKKQLEYEQIIRNKKQYSRIGQYLKTKHKDRFVVQDASDLLTPLRFDITAKTFYARYKNKNIDNSWAKYVYEHHLDVWGGITEKNPPKNSIEDFYNSFDIKAP